jgi:PKD repeat protein
MRKGTTFILLILLNIAFIGTCKSQGFQGNENTLNQLFSKKSEVYFRFTIGSKEEIHKLTKTISIDNVKGDTVWGYANRKEFSRFIELGYKYTLLPNPGDLIHPVMVDKIDLKSRQNWDYYPTYNAYLDLLTQFKAAHPDICKIDTIGVLASGRMLLAVKISDNVNVEEGEPEFLYTSSIHGDEVCGYVLMLHLIDYLLTNYGTDTRVTNMVNNMVIWINPLANPDGTYHGGNNTVNGATRYNANGVDMNRNYPDPEDGQHPDGEAWQPETVFFMNFASAHHLVMSANFHGGAEVVNYPWDTWAKLHPDNNWWVNVSREYADTVHAHSSGYLTDLNNGITNGYAWYEVAGGRQDYMNYFQHCREVTIELSSTKLLPASQLESHWNYNYRSFLNYIEQASYGITGTVTDSLTGEPLKAKVFIQNHDVDSSYVYSSTIMGDYHRPIKAGSYTVVFSAPCHYSKTIQNVAVTDLNATTLNVQLQPYSGLNPTFSADKTNITFGEDVHFADVSCGNPISWQWTFEGGTPSTSMEQNPVVRYSDAGSYDVSLTISDGNDTATLTKQDYIVVAQNILMGNNTVTTCSGNFYDSGGPNGSYSNNENYVMTINPATQGAMLKVTFNQFSTESGYDKLYIYNGANTSSPQVQGSPFTGSASPGQITASNTSGALTFKFTSDGSQTALGWAATIECMGGSVGHTIGGKVTYPNTSNTPLSNVSINLKNSSGVVIGTTTTNASGDYAFTEVADGTYTLEVSTTKLWGGVTATDALLFKKHIANITPLSGIYLACGDINGNGSLTASDILMIKKRIGSIITTFPLGDWLFNNQNIVVNNENVTQNFNGIVYGDANASYSLTDNNYLDIEGDKTTAATSLSFDRGTFSEGKWIIPVRAAAFSNLGSFQFTVQYDPSKLSFENVIHWFNGIEPAIVGNTEAGKITFVWTADNKGIDIDEGILCNIVLKSISSDASKISWSNNPTGCEFSDFDANIFDVALKDGLIDGLTGTTVNSAEDISIYPNPGNGIFQLYSFNSSDTKSGITIYNSLGKLVYNDNQVLLNQNCVNKIDLSMLCPGVYVIEIQTGNEKIIKKLIINK